MGGQYQWTVEILFLETHGCTHSTKGYPPKLRLIYLIEIWLGHMGSVMEGWRGHKPKSACGATNWQTILYYQQFADKNMQTINRRKIMHCSVNVLIAFCLKWYFNVCDNLRQPVTTCDNWNLVGQLFFFKRHNTV